MGPTYLPRKFKTAIGLAGDNCVDLYTHDLGLLAICEDYKIIGYNMLVGGGFGMTPSAQKTFPALGKRMTFVTPDQVLEVATAIVKVQRDFGNRSDRKVARLKYLIADWGIEKFKAKVEEYYGQSLPEPHPEDVWGFDDHIGWHEQGDGKLFYGLNIENGRVHDVGDFKLKSALREICTTLKPGIRLTSHQSILFADIASEDRDRLEQILHDHGVKTSEEISTVRRWSMACVALPTCPLSITESERALPGMIDQIEIELSRLGLSNEAFTIRMTGCPERMCPALQLGYWFGWQECRKVHRLCRRSADWQSHEFYLSGFRSRRRSRDNTHAAVRLFQERSQGRRDLGRFL